MPFDPDMSDEDQAALEAAWDPVDDEQPSQATESVETADDRLNRVLDLWRDYP